MPGTHTKWVSLKDGVIEHFLTALTRRAVRHPVHEHSVLVNAAARRKVAGGPAFKRALEKTKHYPDGELIHLLFEVRSRQLRANSSAAMRPTIFPA